jgi:hypothetical protein
LFSIHRFGAFLLPFAGLLTAADTPLWEPGKVVAVEQVSTPAKEPAPDCRSVPKGTTPPPHCRPAYLRAQQFWRVTVDVGNKRFVVRPYRAPKLLNALSDAGADWVDPNLTTASPVEVAVLSNKAVRLRADQGPGMPAIVDSQQLLAGEAAAPPPRPKAAASVAIASPRSSSPRASAPPVLSASLSGKIVLLENSDFRDLEVQQFKSQDIGDGAVIYSFAGDSSEIRIGSNPPVFLVLGDSEAAMVNPELSRLQVAKGARQMVYSAAKNHSASPVPIVVTPVSGTVRKVTSKEPLPPGEYVLLPENSTRGFLFEVR